MSKIALIIIYNHQYNQNIERLEQIYKNRFSNIYHLMPFYLGEKSNVIPVYENSECFQGYVAQGLKSIFNNDYEHYFFIADDLLLNPSINETNYKIHFKLNANTCFLPNFISLHEVKNHWVGLIRAFNYNIGVTGVEAKNLIPDYNTALEKFSEYGLEIKPLNFDDIWFKPAHTVSKMLNLINMTWFTYRRLKNKLTGKKYNLTYPMVGSYSDIFIVSADTIKLFSNYCGITAATGLFVEVGMPTSMVLSAAEIVTETSLDLKSKTLWKEKDYKILEEYNSLSALLNGFPKDLLYIHPIKLSKWA